eukprot:TRINITY_DN19233_c0_g1_i2.p1 TRINITY_DN19233_c0_g1~~TRINITY_DN19233_c0_g1_i2.p1  ORF type:complete len:254 (+),score=46.70 TRINITY_DN19233_c0_g1_i2:30-791(+)
MSGHHPKSPLSSSSAASDVYKRQYQRRVRGVDCEVAQISTMSSALTSHIWEITLGFTEDSSVFFTVSLVNVEASHAATSHSTAFRESLTKWYHVGLRGNVDCHEHCCSVLQLSSPDRLLKNGFEYIQSCPKRVGGPHAYVAWGCDWRDGVKHGTEVFAQMWYSDERDVFPQSAEQLLEQNTSGLANGLEYVVIEWSHGLQLSSQVVTAPGQEARNVLIHDTVSCLREDQGRACLLYTSPSPRDRTRSRMPSSA